MDTAWFEGLAPLMVGAMLFGALFTFVPGIRRVAQWFTTLVHEAGHALIAVPFGGRPQAIQLRLNGSGQADVAYAGGLLFKPVRIVSLLAGYASPLYLGLMLPWLIVSGHGSVAGFLLAGLGIFSLFAIRNAAGFLIILLYGLMAAIAVMFSAHPLGVAVMFAYASILFIRGVLDLISAGRLVFGVTLSEDTDFHLLQTEVFFIHRYVWYVLAVLLHLAGLGWLFINLHVPLLEQAFHLFAN